MEGTVVRAAGGFFLVRDGKGDQFLCRARGRLNQSKASLLVGDRVLFQPAAGSAGREKEGVIETVLPRFNALYRPTAANVDQLILVTALRDPAPDWLLASRLLALAERQEMAAILCLNKTDLLTPAELAETARLLKLFPYQRIFTSVKTGQGLDELEQALPGHCSVFAGPSGAGKSSLLNAIQPDLLLKTGSVSDKIGRGRHTTRVAELLALPGGGSVVDTPGFSRLDFVDLEPQSLPGLFPEMEPFTGQCAFRDCRHIAEPGCAIRKAVDAGEINFMRFQHYKAFFQELMDRRDEKS
ncbi:MAG: ribosome small subunit-dependent GTPase A [Bacillota bacterium]